MALRILSAIYRNGSTEEEITISEMTKEKYEKIYKGYLFCPTEGCNAKIIYASGEKVTPYFKTSKAKQVDNKIINEHDENCIHYVEYDLQGRVIRRNNPELYYALSATHIKKVLKNTYDRQFNPDKFKKKGVNTTPKKKSPSNRGKNSIIKSKGQAGLSATDGAIKSKGREPNIYRKSIEEVSINDYDSVQCIYGFIEDMILDNDYPYIIFKTNDNKKARILFSEAFAVNYPTQYDNVHVYKNYIDSQPKENPAFCSCVGKVLKDDFEYTILLEDYFALEINNKNYYQIINDGLQKRGLG